VEKENKTPHQPRPSNQDILLNESIEKNKGITLYLKNGVHFSGKVKAHDNHTILLSMDDHYTMVYKHVVTSLIHR